MTALELLDWATPPGEPGNFPNSGRINSIRRTLLPIFRHIADTSPHWRAESVGSWKTDGEPYWMPRLTFQRDGREAPSIKLAIFAGLHGDEPAGVQAIGDFVLALDGLPAMARQYLIHVYPICNPTGFEDGTRHSRAGLDLNREFWKGSAQPEVQLIEKQIEEQRYDGIISLHSDDTSDGLYGFVRGATLAVHLLKPALAAAEAALPVNRSSTIDGFHAVEGIIHSAYDGILCSPPGLKPAPFEIILESPTHSPMQLQRAAFVLALVEIIRHYRRMIAFAADI